MVLVNPLQKEQKFPSKVLRKKTNGLSNNIENNKKTRIGYRRCSIKKVNFFGKIHKKTPLLESLLKESFPENFAKCLRTLF